jgi:hypothetical protein
VIDPFLKFFVDLAVPLGRAADDEVEKVGVGIEAALEILSRDDAPAQCRPLPALPREFTRLMNDIIVLFEA